MEFHWFHFLEKGLRPGIFTKKVRAVFLGQNKIAKAKEKTNRQNQRNPFHGFTPLKATLLMAEENIMLSLTTAIGLKIKQVRREFSLFLPDFTALYRLLSFFLIPSPSKVEGLEKREEAENHINRPLLGAAGHRPALWLRQSVARVAFLVPLTGRQGSKISFC
ncbi:MAG: hypothetical protein AAB361_02705 [Patescibacteria group bacterium]